jgi:hypothetical protein
MDRLNENPEAENQGHFYGFTWWMKSIYLSAAALTLVAALLLAEHASDLTTGERIWRWVEVFALAATGLYFAASAFWSCVLIDDYSVNVRGLFFTSSLPRKSIQWYSLAQAQWIPCTILYPDAPETKKLIVVHCYRFDDEWEQWIAGLKRLPSPAHLKNSRRGLR